MPWGHDSGVKGKDVSRSNFATIGGLPFCYRWEVFLTLTQVMEQRFIALQTALNEKIAVTSSSRKSSKNGLIVSKSMGFPSLPVVGWLLGHFAHKGAQKVGWLLGHFAHTSNGRVTVDALAA